MDRRLHAIVVASILVLFMSVSYAYAIVGSGSVRILALDATSDIPDNGGGVVTAGGGGGGGDSTAPTVVIVSPGAGWSLTNIIDFIAAASDDSGVARVEFYIDGQLRATDNDNPYSFALDTTKETNGTHSISVAAFDTSGNVASAAQFVTFSNGGINSVQATMLDLKKQHLVHIGAFRSLKTANRRVSMLKRRGFNGEVIVQGGSRPYLVKVAAFDDLLSARNLLKRLGRKGFSYRGIVEVNS